jgi:hypothetical protein
MPISALIHRKITSIGLPRTPKQKIGPGCVDTSHRIDCRLQPHAA